MSVRYGFSRYDIEHGCIARAKQDDQRVRIRRHAGEYRRPVGINHNDGGYFRPSALDSFIVLVAHRKSSLPSFWREPKKERMQYLACGRRSNDRELGVIE